MLVNLTHSETIGAKMVNDTAVVEAGGEGGEGCSCHSSEALASCTESCTMAAVPHGSMDGRGWICGDVS
jgi:hypothetical protein